MGWSADGLAEALPPVPPPELAVRAAAAPGERGERHQEHDDGEHRRLLSQLTSCHASPFH